MAATEVIELSEILAAMKRQIPTARSLLSIVTAARVVGAEGFPLPPGTDPAQLEADLTRFIAAIEQGRDQLGAVHLWVKLGPILRATGLSGTGPPAA